MRIGYAREGVEFEIEFRTNYELHQNFLEKIAWAVLLPSVLQEISPSNLEYFF